MMREEFPPVKPGQPVTAGRENRKAVVLERMARMMPGPGMSGHHGEHSVQFGVAPEEMMFVVTITDEVTTGDDPPIYLGTIRRYNFDTKAWTDQTRKWQVDAKGLDITLSVGDRVTVVWDGHRGMFIPTSTTVSEGPFTVILEKDGGVAGSPDPAGVDCSWTYEVSNLGGTVLATGISPERARHPKTIYLEAGAGGRSVYGIAQWIEQDESESSGSSSESGEISYDVLILLHVPGEIESSGTC